MKDKYKIYKEVSLDGMQKETHNFPYIIKTGNKKVCEFSHEFEKEALFCLDALNGEKP